jgi:hypothetical protein
MNVTVRIIDYKTLRRSYVRWRLDHPAILEWYRRWTSSWQPITQQ